MATIIRSTRSRVGPSLYFGGVGLLFVGLLFNNEKKSQALVIVLIMVCLFGVIRSIRSGYIAMTTEELVVRTILRKRVFPLTSIATIEPQEISQVTRRVIPVIKFRDGSSYKLAEFFMQKRAYEANVQENQIGRLIAAITPSIE
jgi:hypothetical protein